MPRTILTREIKLTHPKRGSRSNRRIFIATEGFHSEKKYLKALGDIIKTNIEVIIISRQSPDSGLSAPQYVLQTILDKKSNIDFRIGDDFWIIIDTDRWDIGSITTLCSDNNVSIIVSNPCFEIWILFHYLRKNQINTIQAFPNCDSVISAIKEFDDHFSKTRPVTKRTFNGLKKAVWFAKELDINTNSAVPENPCSRMYKLIEELQADSK